MEIIIPLVFSPRKKETPAEIISNTKNREDTWVQKVETISLKFSFTLYMITENLKSTYQPPGKLAESKCKSIQTRIFDF